MQLNELCWFFNTPHFMFNLGGLRCTASFVSTTSVKESNGTGGSAPGNKQRTLIFLCGVLDCENSRLAEQHSHFFSPSSLFSQSVLKL